MGDEIGSTGETNIIDSKFINNKSEYGTIFHIHELSYDTGSSLNINDCEFTNNTASKFGGVIYTGDKYFGRHASFSNCQFNNNHATLGNIIYVYSNDAMPMNIGNLNPSDVHTFPTFFERNGNSNDNISILSGDSIPENITCKYNIICMNILHI